MNRADNGLELDLFVSPFSATCQFAHGVSDLRSKDYEVKYKTELCKRYHSVPAPGPTQASAFAKIEAEATAGDKTASDKNAVSPKHEFESPAGEVQREFQHMSIQDPAVASRGQFTNNGQGQENQRAMRPRAPLGAIQVNTPPQAQSTSMKVEFTRGDQAKASPPETKWRHDHKSARDYQAKERHDASHAAQSASRESLLPSAGGPSMTGCKFASRCKFIHDEYRIQAGAREFWLVCPSEQSIKVEVVDERNKQRLAQLVQLVAEPPTGPVSPLTPEETQGESETEQGAEAADPKEGEKQGAIKAEV